MKDKLPPTIHLEKTTSTNDYLHELIKSDNPEEGTVVLTEFQTAGKGQRGNVWQSHQGENLLFSMVLYPCFVAIPEQFIISQCAALAVKNVLSEYASGIRIKWPNDIYLKNRKICGMLIENTISENKISSSIIGIGINVNQDHFEKTTATPPVSLKQILGKEVDKQEILEKVINQILFYYSKIKENKASEVEQEYKKDLFSTGIFRDVKTNQVFSSEITGIEPNGILILEENDGTVRRYAFKEVEFVINRN